jgi:hypothetical protein
MNFPLASSVKWRDIFKEGVDVNRIGSGVRHAAFR